MTGNFTGNFFDKAAHELSSTLALMRRQVACRALNVRLQGDLVYVSPFLRAHSHALELARWTRLRLGTVATQWAHVRVLRSVLAGERPAVIRGDQTCSMRLEVGHMPLLGSSAPLGITLAAHKPPVVLRWPVALLPTRTRPMRCPALARPPVGRIQPVRFKTRQATRKIQPLKGTSRAFPAVYLRLPILKSPIPAFRFSAEWKDRFRRALADKAATAPANILLSAVYSGLNRRAFASVSADDRGLLSCVPRAEAVGKRRALSEMGETCYLAVGQRMDTRARLSALVSAEAASW